MRSTVLFLVLIVTFFSGRLSQAQQVHTYVDVDSVSVGDVFSYTIVINGMFDTLEIEDPENFDDKLELISRDRYSVSESRDSLVYRFQYFGTEDLLIPRKQIRLTSSELDTTLYTSQVPIFFKSALAEGDEEFRPFKPIFDFARTLWPYLLLFLLLIIIGYLLYRWNSAREATPEPEPVKPPPPFVNPLKQLKDHISALNDPVSLKSPGEFEEFYIKLGDSIRLYLKRVYQFPALEMTTREIHNELQKELVNSSLITITRKVLNSADIVKFANFQPGTDQAEEVMEQAKKFISTAEVMNDEQIRYLKYRHEIEHGIIKDTELKEVRGK